MQKPELPKWHIPRTNGINDKTIPPRYINAGFGGYWCEIGLNRKDGNRTFIEPEDYIEITGEFEPVATSYNEPCFVVEPYELIKEWIPRQEWINAAMFEASDGSILQLLAEEANTRLIVSAKEWMNDPNHYSGKLVHHWYPKMEGVYVWHPEDKKILMHQKYLYGFDGFNTSLIMGSFNITENAKRSMESVLFIRKCSFSLAKDIETDFMINSRHCKIWDQYLAEVT